MAAEWRLESIVKKRGADEEAGPATKVGKAGGKDGRTKGGGSKGSGASDNTVLDALMAVQRLALRTAADHREIFHILADFWLIPLNHDIFKAAAKAGKLYAELVQQQGKGHQLGSPHVYVAVTTIEAMKNSLQVQEGDQEAQEHHRVLSEWFASANSPMGQHFIAESISMFRAKEAFNGDPTKAEDHKGKLHFAINTSPNMVMALRQCPGITQPILEAAGRYHPQKLQSAVSFALQQAGGVKAKGPAPKVTLERTVQAQLMKFQQNK